MEPTRRKPEVGDIFTMQLPGGEFLFGRVIDTNANPLGVGGAVLIYIYKARAPTRVPPPLSRDHLLVPPLMTNRLPWSKGYFEHIENRPLSKSDVLSQHTFKDVRGRCVDERGNELPGIAPVGTFGLHSYRTIDDEISKAVGLPLSTAR